MPKFKSMTLAELMSEIKNFKSSFIVGSVNYGDHCNTMQAIAITCVQTGFIEESGYSNTNFKIIEDGKENKDSKKVIVLNTDSNDSYSEALTGDALLKEIQEFINNTSKDNLDLLVTYGSDFGDHINTTQANAIHSINCHEAKLKQTSYSTSGWAVCEEEQEEEQAELNEYKFYAVA